MIPPRLVRSLSLPSPADAHVRLGAASAVALVRDRLYIAADDQVHLAVIEAKGQGDSSWIRTLPLELPVEPSARKAVKPDFEALLLLPASNQLVALPSASTARRMTAAVIDLSTHAVRSVDLSAFYGSLGIEELNLEGACIMHGRLFLLQRGSAVAPRNFILEFHLAPFEAALRGERRQQHAPAIHNLELPPLDGVRLSPTDLIALDSDRMLFTAAAEAAPNAYEDGPTLGSCVGIADTRGRVLRLERVSTPGIKLEGITILGRAERTKLLAVADQDDAGADGQLFELEL